MKSIFLCTFLLVSTLTFCQSNQYYPNAFEKNDFIISAGLGLGHWKDARYPYSFRTGTFPAINASVHYGVSDFISLGPLFAFYARTFKYEKAPDLLVFHAHRYFLGGTASIHVSPWIEKVITQDMDSEHLDFYISLGGGYKGTIFLYPELVKNEGEAAIIAFAGMHYYLGDYFGLFIEAGYTPFSALVFGITSHF